MMAALFVVMCSIVAILLWFALFVEVYMYLYMYLETARYHRALDEQRRQADADARRYVDDGALR